MTASEPDPSGNERQGEAVRRTYADFRLSPAQRARHQQRLSQTTPPRRRSIRLPAVSAELVAIGAAALLLIVSVAIWQSLDPGSSTDTSGPAPQRNAAEAATARAQAVPFPIPAACPAAPWSGPEGRLAEQYPDTVEDAASWAYSYYLDGSGIALNTRQGLLYAGANEVFWLTSSYLPQDVAFTAERLDGASKPAAFSFGQPFQARTADAETPLTVRSATLTFPSPGCWRISATSQDAAFRKLVYVYPSEE